MDLQSFDCGIPDHFDDGVGSNAFTRWECRRGEHLLIHRKHLCTGPLLLALVTVTHHEAHIVRRRVQKSKINRHLVGVLPLEDRLGNVEPGTDWRENQSIIVVGI